MRLVYVCDALAVCGGLERVLTDKMNWLAAQDGLEVCVVTTEQGNHPLAFQLDGRVVHSDLGVAFHRQYRVRAWLRPFVVMQLHRLYRRRLKEKLQELRPDILVCVRLSLLRDVLRVKGGTPVIFESHASRRSSRFEGDGLLRRLRVSCQQLGVKRVDRVVALTEGDAAEWRQLTPRVAVIPDIVAQDATDCTSDGHAKSVLFVGRFSRQKDVPMLLDAWRLVHERHADWQLHIYGSYGDSYRQVVAALGRSAAGIVVHDSLPMTPQEYARHSMLLLTSRYEPFGLVMVEAMSCGLPVVAFDCPYGPASIMTPGVDGLLVTERCPAAFADAVCSLIEQPDRRLAMGRQAFLSSRRYRAETVMPRWQKLFSEVYNRQPISS